jgi:outer membrane immunogenic protein
MIAVALRCAASAAVLALAAGAASAQTAREDTGFYIQGGYSYFNFEAQDSGYSVDTNAVTGRVGFQMTPHLGIEADLSAGVDDGDFDFDSDEDDLDFDDNNDGDFTDVVNVSGDIGMDYLAAAYVRGVLPISDRFDLSARVGYAYVQLDANAVTPGGNVVQIGEDAEDGWSAGAGVTFDITENLELRADYTWYGFDAVDADAATLALGVKF